MDFVWSIIGVQTLKEADEMVSIFDEVPNRNDMAELIHEVREGNGLAVEMAQALNQRIDQEAKKYRKKRRKEVRSWMIAQADRFSIGELTSYYRCKDRR